jgi:predicted DCC family thiol-disulfide oxidoreductase YuxK
MVVFWKTDCPYCKNLLAEVDSLLQRSNEQQLQVMAICLDHNKEEWQNHPFVQKRYGNLYQYCDGQGYSGEAAVACHVFATPTMLLFNKQHELMALPRNVKELERLILQSVVADGR